MACVGDTAAVGLQRPPTRTVVVVALTRPPTCYLFDQLSIGLSGSSAAFEVFEGVAGFAHCDFLAECAICEWSDLHLSGEFSQIVEG